MADESGEKKAEEKTEAKETKKPQSDKPAESKPPQKEEKAAAKAGHAEHKKPKISRMTLETVEKALREAKEKMGGFNSRYAQHLLARKQVLSQK